MSTTINERFIVLNPSGIERYLMPQIKRSVKASFIKHFEGVTHLGNLTAVCKPSQKSVDVTKVQYLMDNSDEIGIIIVSNEGIILDGHHNWKAAANLDLPIKVCKINLSFKDLYYQAHAWVDKRGVKKLTKAILGSINRVKSQWNNLQEDWTTYVENVEMDENPMEKLINSKIEKLKKRVDILNLQVKILEVKGISIMEKLEAKRLYLTGQDESEERDAKIAELNLRIQETKSFTNSVKATVRGLSAELSRVNQVILAGFLNESFAEQEIVSLLEGSIYQLAVKNDDTAAVDVLKEYTNNPEALLAEIKSKLEDLKGFTTKLEVSNKFWSDWDVSYPKAYIKARTKLKEVQEAKEAEQLKLLLADFATAGKVWIPKPILELIGDHKFSITKTYEGQSVVKQNGGDSFSLPLKEAEGEPVSPEAKRFLSSATAEALDMPILLSSGGGMQFLNPVFLRAFQYVTESLVDIKAYIASANSSAVRKTIETDMYIGTQVHVLLENGSPVMVDGKEVAIASAAEGSHWFPRGWGYAHKIQSESNHVAVQIRGLSQDFMTEVIQPAAESHKKHTAKTSDWLSRCRGQFFTNAKAIVREAIKDTSPLAKLQPLKGKKSVLLVTVPEELSARLGDDARSWNPGSRVASKLAQLAWNAKLSNAEKLINGKSIVFPVESFWNFGELETLEGFRTVEKANRIAYLNALASNAVKHWCPDLDQNLFNIGFVSGAKVKDGSGNHLLISIEGATANVSIVARYLANIVKQDLEDRAQAKVFGDLGYWPSLGAESYDDFISKWKAGHKFVGFEDAFEDLKKFLPDLVEACDTKWGIQVFALANRRGKALHTWSAKWFNLSLFEGKTVSQIKAENDGKVEVPEYKRETLWGWPCKSKSVFIKGIAVDHVTNPGNEWRFLDGEVARQDIPVASGLDGIKCEHKKLVVGNTEKLLNQHYHIVSWDDPKYGVDARGFENFTTRSIVLSKETEKVSLGIMKIFKTGKVVVTSQFLEKLPTDLYRAESDSSVIHATEKSSEDFKNYLGESWEWISKAFDMLRTIPTGLIETSDYYKNLDSANDRLSPSQLFLNLMAINSRHFEAPTFWDDISESVSSGKNAEINSVLEALDATMECSTALQQAMIEMVNSRLNQACKGSIIKGKYFVVKNFELLPDRVMVIHKKYRTLNGGVEGAAWRFPIATATSLMNVEIVFSDDDRYLPTLTQAGICSADGEMADVVLMNSKCKLWFQQDDDGDQFGLIVDPKPITQEDFCKLEWHIKNAGKDYGSEAWVEMVKFAKKLYRKLEAKVVIALTKLRRHDYPSVDIEMETIPGGKALFKFLDDHGVSTKEFRELSSENLQGPVGLVSDLMTVVLASGEHDHELVRVARTLGYLLQHCIDSAKKNKLMIPAAVLMHDDFWTITSTGRHEMVAIGNAAVMEWNEAWRQLDLDAIKDLEDKYSFLPKAESVLSSLKYDHKYLYFASCTLLSHLQKKAKAGAYGEIELFGVKYPVPATAVDCIDETRYISAHVFNVVDVKDRNGKQRAWSQMANFRTIRIEDYLATVRRKVVLNDEGDEAWRLFWPEVCDGDGYSSYWTRCPDEENGFAGVTTHSIPNFVFKEQLRFSMEMIFNGKSKLIETSKKWRSPVGNEVAFETVLSKPYVSTEFFQNPIKNPYISMFLFGENSWSTGHNLTKEAVSFCTNFLSPSSKSTLSRSFLSAASICVDRYECWSSLLVEFSNSKGEFDFEAFYLKCQSSTATEDEAQVASTLLAFLRDTLHSFVIHQLGQNSWSNKEFKPNLMQKFFCAMVNSYFRKEITKNGREPDRNYKIPWRKATEQNPEILAFLRKPDLNWFKGDYLVWKQIAIGIASDLVIKAIGSIPVWDFCEFTSTIDIRRDGAVEEVVLADGSKYEKINILKLNQAVSTYSIGHIKLVLNEDGEGQSINDCPCCKARIRKQVAEVQRSAVLIRGTDAYESNKIAMAAVKTAITCLESVKDQAQQIVDKAIASKTPLMYLEEICSKSAYGLTPETVLMYAKAYGSADVKVAFGYTTEEQAVEYKNFQALTSKLKLDFKKIIFEKIQTVNNNVNWWTLPLPYIEYAFTQMLEKNENFLTFDEWQDNNDDPQPPTSGGGGSASESNVTKIMVTGHRPQRVGGYNPNPTQDFVKSELERVIQKLNNGSVELVTGMALGVDQWFCEIGLKLSLKVHAYLPCKGQSAKWRPAQKEHHRNLTLQCDWRLISKDTYTGPKQLLDRNTAMVNDSNIAIIVWDGKKEGGTWHAVQEIRKASHIKQAIHINPATRRTTEMFKR